ncbi:hypothetical protein OCU04_003413 [Sclerotinia nivalis]|uniref:Uncharacterized protein n=1 Tax=Sclerotinia nivalis TaxID=352851 RepID=A0A9X0DN68_9HELO|nr:hypothetical protein OCU04_003413 [Sclerotinia nivalis]
MASRDSPLARSMQPQQTSSGYSILHEHGFRSMNDEAVDKAHRIIDKIRANDIQASDRGASVGAGDISDYAMMHEQGFDGMKDFMESHGLRLWNDEDVQAAHEIIQKMREFDEKYDHLPTSAEESDSDVAREEIIEDDLRRETWVDNTYAVSGYEIERNVVESTGFTDPQDEEFFDGIDYLPEGLESGGIDGSDGYFEDVEEGFNTFDFEGEGGYIDNEFGEGGYGGYDDDVGDDAYDGYDDGYDYDGDYG